jgi:hypothetical protein
VNRITSVLLGASVALVQLLLAGGLDAGIIRSRATFYLACTAVAIAIGALARIRRAKIAHVATGATLATVALYKVGIRRGRWSDVANDLDWTTVLLLTAVGVGLGAVLAHWALRRQAAA